MNFINNCRQLYNMKSLKSQPTSYKDFVQQIGKAKAQKNSNQYKIKQTPKGSHTNTLTVHSQSTSIWEKRSPSQNRLMTQVSAEKKIKSHNQSIQETRTPTLSQKDKVLCYHKFISEASVILTILFKIPVPELLTNRISYIQYLEALKALKMIYQSYEPYPNDLVSQLWCQYISGQNIGNFLIIISSILGMHQSKLSQQDKYLKNKYQSMRFTRMQLNKSISQENYQENQCTFMPQISDRSRRLAESASKSKSKCKKSSRKVLKSINTDKSLTERLIIDNNNNHERSKASIDYDQDYNFYGSTTEPVIRKVDVAGNRRSQLLYEKAKQKSCEKRENKSSNDIQFQKSKKQLTFKPTILKVKSKQQLNSNKCLVKGEKNTISRMIRGRVQRQVRRIINQKGVPYNEKFVDKMRKQKYQEITIETNFSSIDKTPISTVQPAATPINKLPKNTNQPKVQPFVKSSLPISEQDLVIDVYLSQEHKEKLMIKKGQNIEEVAGKFIQQHGISHDKKQQLIQLLQLSISHALCPIDELVEEEDQLASARTHHKRQYCR